MTGSHDRLVVIVGDAGPIIACAARPADGVDSGYTCWRASGALTHPDDLRPDDPMLRTVCLDCLLDQHPGLAPALMLALDHGAAERDPEGHWQPAA